MTGATDSKEAYPRSPLHKQAPFGRQPKSRRTRKLFIYSKTCAGCPALFELAMTMPKREQLAVLRNP
jgi:hypothetical protein